MRTIEIDGTEMPALGFGTWKLQGADCVEGVMDALSIGYRHLDVAQVFGNEAEVGKAMASSGVKRDDIWLTVKVGGENMEPITIWDNLMRSLSRLRVEHIDLLVLHFPRFDQASLEELAETIMEAQHMGLCTHLGVANYNCDMMARARAVARIAVNQVEYHPYLAQRKMIDMAASMHVTMAAYGPFAGGRLLEDPVVQGIAAKHNKTPAQVALRWLTQQDHVAAIPHAETHERRVEDFESQDFDLEEADMQALFGLNRGAEGRFINPDWAPEWDQG